jgi:predicted phage gp36 major capsid-like protein
MLPPPSFISLAFPFSTSPHFFYTRLPSRQLQRVSEDRQTAAEKRNELASRLKSAQEQHALAQASSETIKEQLREQVEDLERERDAQKDNAKQWRETASNRTRELEKERKHSIKIEERLAKLGKKMAGVPTVRFPYQPLHLFQTTTDLPFLSHAG